MNPQALRLNKEGKKLLKSRQKQERSRQALNNFDEAIRLEPVFAEAWYNKGLAHLALKQYRLAVSSFSMAFALAPNSKVLKQIKLLKEEHLNTDFFVDGGLRGLICSEEYLNEFELMRTKHANVAKLSFKEQVAWINELMQFVYKYYDSHDKPFAFAISQTLLNKDNPNAKTYRLKVAGEFMAFQFADEPNQATAFADTYILKFISTALDDIFLDDAKIALRMMFETIHQFPRDERGKLLDHLPWAGNSWYFLEFCGSLFIADDQVDKENELGGLPLSYIYDRNNDQGEIIQNFFNAVLNETCLVKMAMLDIVKTDLKSLRQFFEVLSQRLNGHPIEQITISDLPNLHALMWYSKHSANYLRLMALLPNKGEEMNLSLIEGKTPSTPLAQLQVLMHTSSYSQSLKGRLAFLRSMQLVGEMFSIRSWGSHLKRLDFISTDRLSGAIRNGLCHAEDLESFDVLTHLENDEAQISALQKEFSLLKEYIQGDIVKREKHFPLWPNIESGYSTWEKPVRAYWEAVKSYYQVVPPFMPNLFVPKQPLLSVEEIKLVVSSLKPVRVGFFTEVIQMLKGGIPFFKIRSSDFKNLSGKELREPKRLLSLAEDNYKDKRTQAQAELSRKKQDLESKVRDSMDKVFPNIKAVGFNLFEELRKGNEAGVTNTPKQTTEETIKRLKNRMNLLKALMVESKVLREDHLSETGRVKPFLQTDIELLLSTSYVVAQIINMINKLSALGVLESIDADLKKDLVTLVALRNALEHSDPIEESSEITLFQMHSKVYEALAYVVEDLLGQYYCKIMAINESSITPPASATADPGERVKQERPVDLTAFVKARSTASPGTNSMAFFSSTPEVKASESSPGNLKSMEGVSLDRM
ncbi:tetratricopeptide repeat protein [Legionella jordanis]|uniref:Tetratricopeptide repeat protein n=1 Tax=Legionella jordanis TaxID=456 RepID=A0A0W0VA37_9GAMM|nr:tetratricopeptide repeat protein [Legionella jordanis]KTD16489.1 Tetratricopeptide repeat protein [Legionella jordanis]RMX03964.1 tetratricopeptide repeat protein [Legionella jordanis]RMX21967.1 tetratricopeptide repeat protein [Legionella jordanis]VEH12051.1 Predicted O-linked N-acetylglucosamine transferase, SPINDLY family [Legionella jordanis]